jgi:GNAT superfamily N-acetyltransferase
MTALLIRPARDGDVAAIRDMLADDMLGQARERPDLAPYLAAFARIAADPNQALLVGTRGGRVVATMQLTFIPGLSRGGQTRGLIEAVRTAGDLRGLGIGAAMIRHAIDECRARGCGSVQLTTDKSRTDAHRFYDRLGFEQSHFGYKMMLAGD